MIIISSLVLIFVKSTINLQVHEENISPTTEHIKLEYPNVVIMMADDLGWADISPNNPALKYTPNLATLASKGIRFTDYHSAASMCTPSRAGLLTGRLGQRTGVLSNFGVYSEGGLPLTEYTIADHLKHVGYSTAIIGKWHLGHNGEYHPLSRGFDYYFGLPYSNDMGCVTCSPVYDIKVDPQCGRNKNFNISVPLFENSKIVEQPVDLTTLTKRYIKSTKSFISSSLKNKKPFFLYLPMTHVHTPLATDPKFNNYSKLGHFVDTVIEMDNYVGEVMNYLFKKRIFDNTMVIFTSDNGPCELKCKLGGNSFPYSGIWQKTIGGGGSTTKFTTWEGGHRVPFIISWPSKLPAGITSTDLVSAFDILPSLSIIAGFTLFDDRKYDGIPFPFIAPNNATRILFLPDVGLSELWALRYGTYKVYYASNPGADCEDNSGKGFLYHNPALVFDVTLNPQEDKPLSISELPQGFFKNIERYFKEMRDSIFSTFRSSVNWNVGEQFSPCCNKNKPFCAC